MAKTIPPSPGRRKLEALGIRLPLLPVTCAGALPKQPELAEMRYKVAKGVQQRSELERKEKLSMEVWIREQERMSADVLVDGDMDRPDVIKYFASGMNGFANGGLVRIFRNRYHDKSILAAPVEWLKPISVETWRLAQRMTHRPVKVVLPGPYTMADQVFDEHYDSRRAAVRAISIALRREAGALVEAGAKIIQIDELSLSARPDDFALVAEGLKELTRDLKAYFILHHAYGDLRPIWKKLGGLPVDQLSFEGVNCDFLPLELLKSSPIAKDIAIGFVDPQSPTVETARTVTDHLRAALRRVPASRLWLTSGTGLKARTVAEAVGKMKALAQAAEKQRTLLK